jgi:glycosyltransferase involved in cell wall biosynthesis
MNDRDRPVIAVNTLAVPKARLGGGFTYLQNLLPRLVAVAPGARFVLLVAENNRRFFKFNDDRVSLTTLDNHALRGSIRTVTERYLVSTWLRRIRADLYFVPYGWLPQRPPCPTVWTFQNLLLLDSFKRQLSPPVGLKNRAREWARGQVLSHILMPATIKADRIIAVSQTARDDLIAQFPQCRDRVAVVYEGVDQRFTPRGDSAPDATVLSRWRLNIPYHLSVSTLMRHKRHESLIKAFARFKSESDTPGVLAIAGDDWGGYRNRLERLVQKLGAGEFIRFLGHVDPADLPALYRHARSFILLSTCESFGLPALEAMACGCPTIVADTSGSAEVVGNGGVRIDPNDIGKLSGFLHELDILTDQRSALARVGIRRAGMFSWQTTARQTTDIFENVLQRPITKHDGVLSGTDPGETAAPEHSIITTKNPNETVPVGID